MATKKTTTPAPEATKAPSRTDMLATLKARGYTGPTSFTASKLREVVAWVEAGSPRDSATVPTGVLYAVHPDLKPAPKSPVARLTKFQQGYQGALAEVATLSDLAAVQNWVSENRVKA